MTDIYFDPIEQEIVFENGDFKLTDDPSIQNGMILKDAICANIYYPSLGVGVGVNLINSPIERTVNLMNIWAQQCKQDGASKADYKLSQTGNNIDIEIDVNYL